MTTTVKGVKDTMANEQQQILDGQQKQNLDGQNQDMQENNDLQEPEKKQFSKAELEALLKEAETKGFVKGKTDTNARWEKKNAEAIKLAKEEAEKQSRFEKMSELEKAQAKAKENEEELIRLKNQIALNEQKNETRKLMKEKNLPDFMLDAVLVFGDADATAQNIDDAKLIWDAEVQKAVEARIPTHVPKQNQQNQSDIQKKFGDFDEEAARRLLNLKQRV